MQEQVITFETAKLAKEKGFNWKCLFYAFENFNAGLDYIIIDELETQFGKIEKFENHNLKGLYYIQRVSLPTQSLLRKWLREVHNIDIMLYPHSEMIYKYRIYKNGLLKKIFGLEPNYEILMEQGLQEALKLIPEIT